MTTPVLGNCTFGGSNQVALDAQYNLGGDYETAKVCWLYVKTVF